MKIKFFLFLMMFAVGISFGQLRNVAGFEITGGMGIQMAYTPSIMNYVNNNYGYGSQMSTFNNNVEVWIEGVTDYKDNFQLGLEIAYNYFSYSNLLGGGIIYEFDKAIYMPSILGYYLIRGNSYEFKFGVGLGYRFAEVTEKIYSSEDYTASGFGSIVRAQAITGLIEDLYVNLSGDLRYDIIGTPSNGNNKIYDNVLEGNVNLNSFGVTIRIGLTYIF